MIGAGLKKYAAENGMKVAHGVAYGDLRGFAATLSEGEGYKQMVLTTVFSDDAGKEQVRRLLEEHQVAKEYNVRELAFAPNGISIVFTDTIGAMKKMAAFIDWFLPVLEQNGASRSNICTECRTEITAGRWMLMDGIAYHMHDGCCQSVRRRTEQEESQRRETQTGTYGMGLVGALLGAVLGAVVWAIVLNMGYVAAVVGLLIGWLAEKGYTLLKGKRGTGKIVILVAAIIFGVLLGTFAADAFTLVSMINNAEAALEYGEIPGFIFSLLESDSEYRNATIGNVVLGLLFAVLGAFTLLKKTGKEVSDTKFIDLE